MTETKNIAVLFDFDGVVVDTETQYSIFWHKMGVDYLGMEDLESRVKGQTLVYIYNTFFPGMIKEQEEITAGLDRFEQEMTFEFIPGVESFIADLRRNGVKMAVVTSSNDKKMEAVYRAKPEIKTMVRPYSYGRNVHSFQTCTGLLPAWHESIWHHTGNNLRFRRLFQRTESGYGFRSYSNRFGHYQFTRRNCFVVSLCFR